jgi:hypothetical protein
MADAGATCAADAADASGAVAADPFDAFSAALDPHGLRVRGAFHPEPADGVPDFAPGRPAGTLVLIGNSDAAMWDAFAPHDDGAPNPLDRWTRAVVDPIAARFGARPAYPFGGSNLPFQRWALRAGGVHPSPLGLLVSPDFGLWHAYRAALIFAERRPLPPPDPRPSPCEACADRPCLAACPVGAFDGTRYDVGSCAGFLASTEGDACLEGGCRARDACPVGRGHRYPAPQLRFHMRAFARAVGARVG